MDDNLESQQVSIACWWRGPEWAFALPQGDLRALEEVIERCSYFWNGANSLLIPVRADGRVPEYLEPLLEGRPVEHTHLHPRLGQRAAAGLQRRLGRHLGQTGTFWEGFDDHELHPLLVQRSLRRDGEAPPSLSVPVFRSRRLRRVALAAWGQIREVDQPEYEREFDLFPATGPHAHQALVSGQARELSPLAQSVRLLRPYGSAPGFERCLWVFEGASFDEVIEFWNLRSRAPDWRGQALVVGVAREALARPDDLGPLGTWLARDELFEVKPDLGLWVTSSSRDAAAHALEDLGFRRAEGTRITRYDRGRVPLDRREPEYGFFRPGVATEMQRGAVAHDLIAVAQGQATFRPRRPEAFEVRTGHHVRLALQGLPLALPLSSAAAAGTLTNAYRSPEGVTIVTDAYAGTDGYLTVRIPDRWEALEGWAADGGYSVSPSSAARHAQAVLDRLGGLDPLDALADESAVAVLDALAPRSRLKLAQRLVGEARRVAGVGLDEATLAELLKQQDLFLELQARTIGEVAAEAGAARADLLAPLARLVEAGFVRRGALASCPRCRHHEALALSEQDEWVTCRACGERFLLAVLDRGGQESPTVYRLEGALGRAMDQDVLPVMLALRALRPPPQAPPVRAAWPGLIFHGSRGEDEVDLLVSDGSSVHMCECKLSAAGLTDGQLGQLLDMATSLGARPAVAALTGSFAAAQAERVRDAGGRVLERRELLGPRA